jgi:hypothetical protein
MGRRRRRDHPLAQLARTILVLLASAAVVVALAIARTAAPAAPSAAVAGVSRSPLSAAPVSFSTIGGAQVACPSGLSYTVDATAFAFIGSTGACASAGSTDRATSAQYLVIVDAAYGKATSITPLDPLVLAQGLPPSEAGEVHAIRYAGLGWSQNNTYAVAYVALPTPGSFSLADAIGSGLLVLSRFGAPARVFPGDGGFFEAATTSYAGLPVWNTSNGDFSPPLVAAASLAYAWTSNTAPTAIAPIGPKPLAALPTDAGPRYPVGKPAEDATFTIWQPGVVLGPLVTPPGATARPGDGAFITNFTSWSPDGARVTALVAGVALVWPDGSSANAKRPQAQPYIPSPTTLVEVPARDPALVAVEQSVSQSGWALVAWNPDGSLLASVQCGGTTPSSLQLRSTATGAILAQTPLHLAASDPGCRAASFSQSLGSYANPNLRLLWAPDGSRVALSDQAANTVTEWGVLNRQ